MSHFFLAVLFLAVPFFAMPRVPDLGTLFMTVFVTLFVTFVACGVSAMSKVSESFSDGRGLYLLSEGSDSIG